MEIRRLVVIARDHAHFDQWRRENQISRDDRRIVHVMGPRDLAGLGYPPRYVVAGLPESPSRALTDALYELEARGVRVGNKELAAFIAAGEA